MKLPVPVAAKTAKPSELPLTLPNRTLCAPGGVRLCAAVDTELEQVAELTRSRKSVRDTVAELDILKSSAQRLQVKAREAGLMGD